MAAQGPSPPSRYPDHAANERTMLAWVRTGIALMAFGFAIARFGLFLREVTAVDGAHAHAQATPSGASAWLGVALVVMGLGTNALATARYARVRRAIEQGGAVAASPALVYALGIGSALVAVAMALVLARALAR